VRGIATAPGMIPVADSSAGSRTSMRIAEGLCFGADGEVDGRVAVICFDV
jgi:hypothetical protein